MATLDETLSTIWQHLSDGLKQPDHPFRTPVFCTQGESRPNARTLVLQGVDLAGGSLLCFSDIRSNKWIEVSQNPSVAWVFYDPKAQVQLRAYGVTEQLTEGALVDVEWASQSGEARNNFRTRGGPGQVLDTPGDGIPVADRDRESAVGREHFGVMMTRLSELDWLNLADREHWRARFIREELTDWQGQWITP